MAVRSAFGGCVIALCLLGSPPSGVSAQEQKKPVESLDAVADEPQPSPLVDAMLAANAEASLLDPAATLTSSSPIVIPATGTGGSGVAGISAPYPAQIVVSGLPAPIGRLEVRLNHLTHTFPSDLDILLVGPTGQNVVLMSDSGGGTDVDGLFLTFADGAPAVPSPLVSGTYSPTNLAADTYPAPAPAGPHGTTLSSFIGTNPNGVWSLYVIDDTGADIGRLDGFSLIITPLESYTTATAIPDLGTIAPAITVTGLTRPITRVTVGVYLTHTFDNDLRMALIGPDGTTVPLTTNRGGAGDNYGTACTPAGRTTFDDGAATAISAGTAPFFGTYRPEAPLSAFAGKAANGTWQLRVSDHAGADTGTLQCWVIAITTEEPVQPPTGLSVTQAAGNTMTFRWTASPGGPVAGHFVFEGGISPGQVLASIPIGVPSLTLNVPNGAFFVRVRSVAGAETSGASNELPIYVNVPVPPSTPANLRITTNGSALQLSWRNTFEGTAPTGLILDVTGAVTASLPLPLTETFSYNGVPDGIYSFRVRAANAAGVSAQSNGASASFPATPCPGLPGAPGNFRAFTSANRIFVDWDPPLESGRALSHYALSVTGSLAATVPLTQRSISGTLPPGTYNLSVIAVNMCGNGPATPVRTVTIP